MEKCTGFLRVNYPSKFTYIYILSSQISSPKREINMNVVSTIAICLLMMGMTDGKCGKGEGYRAGGWVCTANGNAASVPASATEIFMDLEGEKMEYTTMNHLTNLTTIHLIDYNTQVLPAHEFERFPKLRKLTIRSLEQNYKKLERIDLGEGQI